MSNNQVVLVTGGSRGLGLAIVKRLLSGTEKTQAANVVALSRSLPEELKSLESKFPDALAIVQGDVTKLEDNDRAVKEALGRWKRLDAVVLNAGIAEFSRIENLVCPLLIQVR